MNQQSLKQEAINLLKKLIAKPSFSREEGDTATLLFDYLDQKQCHPQRMGNNVWVSTPKTRKDQRTILLNSHHDTVKPVSGWTKSPFEALEIGERLYGLGSNDAGGCLVSLLATFLYFQEQQHLPFQLIFAATAEEEISGAGGIASLLPALSPIDFAIVGEPTLMQMAIAEKGLMVIDAEAQGKAGHAARNEGVNALYIALEDIQKIRQYHFPKSSPLLGPVKVSATQIEAGTQHNVVPDSCRFVLDVRTNECYTNREVFELLQNLTKSKLTARSFRLNSSGIPLDHPIVQSGLKMALNYYGSPTLSDQALMPFPSLKIGPGDSARSHTADEFIVRKEIERGIETYIGLLKGMVGY
ncbi:MAG: acetylornithine deacetylase [Saprospiraceae bacterium]|nr:MAG: acetylornithine deacetylase [Saprospiraceae bacterium]